MTNKQDAMPSFLSETEPLEFDQLPLQVALLTMEVAALRQILAAVTARLSLPGPAAVPDYGVL